MPEVSLLSAETLSRGTHMLVRKGYPMPESPGRTVNALY